jgi:hypothetical protein
MLLQHNPGRDVRDLGVVWYSNYMYPNTKSAVDWKVGTDLYGNMCEILEKVPF